MKTQSNIKKTVFSTLRVACIIATSFLMLSQDIFAEDKNTSSVKPLPELKPTSSYEGIPYDASMVLVKKGEEFGRKLLKDPNDEKLACVAYHREEKTLRFGFEKNGLCEIGSWGRKTIDMNGEDAFFIHFPKGGEWKNENELKGKHRLIAPYGGTNEDNKRSESMIAFIPGPNAMGGLYYAYDNSINYSDGSKEIGIPRDQVANKGIKIFIPTEIPNPFDAIDYHRDMVLIKKGQENGRELLKAPQGNKLACVAYFKNGGEHLIRMGWADGDICRIGAWGAQTIPLNGTNAFLVHFKNGGQWINGDIAENSGDAEHPIMGLQGNINIHTRHSFAGVAYIPEHDSIGEYYRNGGFAGFVSSKNLNEIEERNRTKIQVFIPNDKLNPIHQIFYNPLMKLIKKGQENGRSILKSPDGEREVCVGVHRRNPHNIRFGYVDGSICHIGSWGHQQISLDGKDAFLVHFPYGGQWAKPGEKTRRNTPVLRKATLGAYGGFNGPNNDSMSNLAYVPSQKSIGGNYFSGVDDNTHNVSYIANNGQETNERNGYNFFQFLPYEVPVEKLFKIDDRIELIPYGQHKGREEELLKDPSGNFVCSVPIELDAFKKDQNKIMNIGFVKDDKCFNEAWGAKTTPMSNLGYYIKSKSGSKTWKKITELKPDDLAKTAITHANDFAKYNSGIASINGIGGRTNPPGTGFTGINKSGGVVNTGDVMIFMPDAPTPENKPAQENVAPVTGISEFPQRPDVSKFDIDSSIKLIKQDQFESAKNSLIKDPNGNYVCAYASEPTPGKPNQDNQLPFGFVKDDKCIALGWEWVNKALQNRSTSMKTDAYYVQSTTGSTSWKKYSELSEAELKNAMLVKPNNFSKWSVGIGSYKGEAGKTHPLSHPGVWGVNAQAEQFHGKKDNDAMIFIPNAPKVMSTAANTQNNIGLDVSKLQLAAGIEFIKYGNQKGMEADLVKDKAGNFVCVMYKKDQKQVYFGYERDNKCNSEAWGVQIQPMDSGLFYLKSKGSWVKRSDLSDEQYKKTELVKIYGDSSWSVGVGSYKNFAGKIHPATHNQIWGVDVQNKVYSGISLTDPDTLVFDPNAKNKNAPVSSTTTPVSEEKGTFASKFNVDPRIELIKYGQHQGKENTLLKDPHGNFVCILPAEVNPGSTDKEKQLVSGYEKDGKCHGEAWGRRDVSMNDGVYYVLVKSGSTNWVKASEFSKDDQNKATLFHANDFSNANIVIASYDGFAGKLHPGDNGIWLINGKTNTPEKKPLADGLSYIFNPEQKKDATTTTATQAGSNLSKYKIDPLIQLIKYGEHQGKESTFLKDPKGNYVCAALIERNPGKNDKDKIVSIGYVQDDKCYNEAWGARKTSMTEDVYYIVSTKGSNTWKKLSELNNTENTAVTHANDFARYNSGIASINGLAGRINPPAKNTVSVKPDGSALITDKGDIMIFIPDAEPVKSPEATTTPVSEDKSSSPYNVKTQTPSTEKTNANPVETNKEEEPNMEPVPDDSSARMQNLTVEDAVKEIASGKLIAADPDSASILEKQPPLNIIGEPLNWVNLGSGFALEPIVLSTFNGVICRFYKDGTMYIGNLYKNKFESKDAKVDDIICRAATNINNLVYLTRTFESLSARTGELPSWQPIKTTAPNNWETGYLRVNVGQEATEDGKTFKVFGVCRMLKEDDLKQYHIGRAALDENNLPHCFLKKNGGQSDLTGNILQNVEILTRANITAAGASAPIAGLSATAPTLQTATAPSVYGAMRG